MERDNSEDLDVDGKILKWIFKKWDGGVDWIDLPRDRHKRRTVVNTAMYLRVPKIEGSFTTRS
jgi:hypothetical protein